MRTTYTTTVLGFGNHAAIEIPLANLAEIGGNKRAPLKITVQGYTYQSTATGMDGKCLVVFPTRDREASGVTAGDTVDVTLELDDGYRHIDVPTALHTALASHKLDGVFQELAYSKRKEYARLVADAKTDETRARRISKIISEITEARSE